MLDIQLQILENTKLTGGVLLIKDTGQVLALIKVQRNKAYQFALIHQDQANDVDSAQISQNYPDELSLDSAIEEEVARLGKMGYIVYPSKVEMMAG